MHTTLLLTLTVICFIFLLRTLTQSIPSEHNFTSSILIHVVTYMYQTCHFNAFVYFYFYFHNYLLLLMASFAI